MLTRKLVLRVGLLTLLIGLLIPLIAVIAFWGIHTAQAAAGVVWQMAADVLQHRPQADVQATGIEVPGSMQQTQVTPPPASLPPSAGAGAPPPAPPDQGAPPPPSGGEGTPPPVP